MTGYIPSAVDLCTRETAFRWVKTRNTNTAAKCLLNDLVFLKGAPLTLRPDNAQELMEGIAKELHTNLCIEQA